jgi:hypothetical protein
MTRGEAENKDNLETSETQNGKHVLKAETGKFEFTLFSPRLVLGSAPTQPERYSVSYEGTVIGASQQLDSGAVESKLAGKPWIGRKNERWAAKTLAQAFASLGRGSVRVADGNDARGIDVYLQLDTHKISVQITAAIQDDRWRDLAATQSDSRTDAREQLADNILEAIRAKARKSAEPDRLQTVLALDAQQTPAACHRDVREIVERLVAAAAGFQYKEIWIVGPTTAATARLFP